MGSSNQSYTMRKDLAAFVHLDGEYGQKDVAAGVPAVIGADGIEEIVEIDLTEEEKSQFAHSCDVIRGYLKKAKEMLS